MQRINSLDLTRGVAVLGLLPMNIIAFAFPLAAYLNPMAVAGDNFANHVFHVITAILFDQKMMGVFSLLFGASVAMLIEKRKAEGRSAAVQHYLRNLVLIVIGLLHAHLLWNGDILLIYGIFSLALFPLYFLPRWLLAIFSLLILSLVTWGLSAANADVSGNFSLWNPTEEMIAAEKAFYLKGYWEYVVGNITGSGLYEDALGIDYLIANLFLALGLSFAYMLAGMALMKSKFWQENTALGFWWGIALCMLGWSLEALMQWQAYSQNWPVSVAAAPLNPLAVTCCVMGYVLIFRKWASMELWQNLKTWLSNTGRMALTHYLSQSLLMTIIFYGFGFGLFMQLDRPALALIVLTVWVFQVSWSQLWLKKFRQGPVEWLWRKCY